MGQLPDLEKWMESLRVTSDSLTVPHTSQKQFDLHLMFSFCLGKYRSSSPFFPSCPPSTVISAQGCLWLPCCNHSVAKWCLTLCNLMDCSPVGFPALHYLPESAQTHVSWISDAIQHLILCHPLLLSPSVFAINEVFSSVLALHIRWPEYWSFSISPSNEYSQLISFRIDWFDLLEVQGTLKSLLQHHNSKASILGHSAFFMVQLSHLYMTTDCRVPQL